MPFRLAESGDDARLAEFRSGPDPLPEYLVEVDDWIQNQALAWYLEPGHAVEPRLMLLFHDWTDELLAVGAHQRGEHEWQRYVEVIAVAYGHHENGHGKTMLASVIKDATAFAPSGAATWLVHPDNDPCIAFCDKAGADWTMPPEDKPYLRYRLDLRATPDNY